MSDGQVKSIIERVLRLQEEKRQIEEDIREVYAEAKGNGYDGKALRAAVKRINTGLTEAEEFDQIVSLYVQDYFAASHASAHPRVPRVRDAKTSTDAPAASFVTAQVDGVSGSSPQQAGDDRRAAGALRISAKSPEVSTGIEGGADRADAGAEAPPRDASPGRQEIGITIPAFLRRGDPACVVPS